MEGTFQRPCLFFSPSQSHWLRPEQLCRDLGLLAWASQAQQEQYSWTELEILRGFKDGVIGASQCMTPFCVRESFWFLIFSLSLLLCRKVVEVPPIFAAPWPAAPHIHMEQRHPPSIYLFAMADKAKLQPQQQRCGRPQGHAVVSVWLLQFRIPPHCYLQILFSLSNLPFVAILALHYQHEKLHAGFSSLSCRGICNWRQLTPLWSTLYSYSCNCKYHPACTQGSPRLIIAFGPVRVCILWSKQKQTVGLAVSATMVSLNLPCGHH